MDEYLWTAFGWDPFSRGNGIGHYVNTLFSFTTNSTDIDAVREKLNKALKDAGYGGDVEVHKYLKIENTYLVYGDMDMPIYVVRRAA